MEENNIIIAKFMGKDLPYINNKGNWEYFVKDAGLINSPNIEDINKFLNFNYHSDWNWLMSVVDKIYQTNLYYGKYIDFNSSMFTTGKIELSTSIEDVYNQCVEFINFYNKQKEE